MPLKEFQSLFSWNSLSDDAAGLDAWRMYVEFQSLFSWNSLSDLLIPWLNVHILT